MIDQALRRKLRIGFTLPSVWVVTVVIAHKALIFLIVFSQIWKDAEADRITQILGERIAENHPPFKDVHMMTSFWANHKPEASGLADAVWNSRYPAIGGTVKTQREFEKLNEIVRTVCDAHGYDHRLVGFFVRLDE